MHHDSGDRPGKNNLRHPTPGGAPSPLDAVRQLLAEKAKFEKWLTDLDAKRATTPVHVFDRVRADYSGRLQGVLDQLKTHASAMEEHAASLTKKLQQLTESEQGMEDTRAESELRAQVGELSEHDWDKISKKLERDLAKVKQDQALIESDLNDLRGLLGSLAAPAPEAETSPPSAARGQAAETAAPAEGSVDELAFLKSVIGTTAPPQKPAADGAVEARADAPSAATPEAQPAKPAAAKPAVEKPAAEKPAAPKMVNTPPPGPVIKSRPGEEPLAMHVTGANPIVLRSSGVVEQPKTLKCGECGSMNYPSEWYCERCGAELTSI